MVWSGFYGQQYPGWSFRRLFPGSTFDYEREVGDPWLNSAVSNGIAFAQKVFPEAELRVTVKDADGADVPIPKHPMVELLRRPNDQYSGTHLWKATLLSWYVDGNAYWRVLRGAGGMGRPVQLWYVPHFRMRPHWPADGSQYIDYYQYLVDGKWYRLEVADVVHFRNGIDPYDERMGWSKLKAVLREVYTDNELSTFSAALLRNGGVPSLFIAPMAGASPMQPDQVTAFKGRYREEMTGDGRGGVFVSNMPVEPKPIGFSPADLNADTLGQRGELRIAGAFGFPAALLQFQAGLEQARNKANYEELRKVAYRQGIIPCQSDMADELDLQLLPQLTDHAAERVTWDYTNVKEMQEDVDSVHGRARDDYKSGIVRRSEARAMIGLKSDAEDEVYYTELVPQAPPDDFAEERHEDEAEEGDEGPMNAPRPGDQEPDDDGPDEDEDDDEEGDS